MLPEARVVRFHDVLIPDLGAEIGTASSPMKRSSSVRVCCEQFCSAATMLFQVFIPKTLNTKQEIHRFLIG